MCKLIDYQPTFYDHIVVTDAHTYQTSGIFVADVYLTQSTAAVREFCGIRKMNEQGMN